MKTNNIKAIALNEHVGISDKLYTKTNNIKAIGNDRK